MIKKVDHLGVAVMDLEESILRWRDHLGYSVEGMEDVPERDVRVAFLRLEGSPPIELITPLKQGSAVDRFLKARGEGIHHICYEVGNIREAIDSLRAEGVELVGEAPGAGAEGAQTLFIHPRSFNGVLIELKQKS
jgi:methylmalonyl-CoA/ethylmalonyl-CoA epimerase